MGVTRRRGAARFIHFTRLPGGGGVFWGGFASDFCRQPLLFVLLPSWRYYQPRHRQQSALHSSAYASPKRQHLFWSEGQPFGGDHWTNVQTHAPSGQEHRKVGQCPTHLPRIVVVVIHLNNPELHRRKWSVTVTFPRSNGTGRPVSSLISVSTLPNSRLCRGMYSLSLQCLGRYDAWRLMMFLFSKFDFLRRPIWFAGMLVRCFPSLGWGKGAFVHLLPSFLGLYRRGWDPPVRLSVWCGQ